jgi:arabinogalactan endo-1,4-beta-galactosidase
MNHRSFTHLCARLLALAALTLGLNITLTAQQPTEPVDVSPIKGEMYYFVNQYTGDQMDLISNSTTAGANIQQSARSFTGLSQRWAVTKLNDGNWKISNIYSGLCLDAPPPSSGATFAVENSCTVSSTQEWSFAAATNGYYTVHNAGNGYVLDIFNGSQYTGAYLDVSSLGSSATQTQQWLLRPVFLRGIDNALLEKEEALRVTKGLPWWQDNGATQDVLQMMKNHGVNTIRIRPSSQPPYATQTGTSCSGNLCYAETDAQDVDLAMRAKNLGMTVELSLLFDGGSSYSVPAAWSGETNAQLQTSVYNYVKAEVESFRSAGVMPDLVAVGNEVDNGFLGYYPSSSTSSDANFAALQKQGLQAVRDAASDTSIGTAIPAPLTCIHITPNYSTNVAFFEAQTNNGVVYDAVCQSYYPFYHGPLTQAQATASNPNKQAVEQATINSLATTIAKPVFLMEVAEHYEANGYASADPWYAETTAGQRQFLIDVNNVVKAAPSNYGMGIEYWDPTGVNIPKDNFNNYSCADGYVNGDGLPDATFVWNSLTLFDNADGPPSYCSTPTASNYSAMLPGMDALGGKFDNTLSYKLVNEATGGVLESYQASNASGAYLDVTTDNGSQGLTQQWLLASNGNGYFTIKNNGGANPANVLDDPGGSTTAGAQLEQLSLSGSGTAEQLWNVVTAGNGYYYIVNDASGQVLDLNSSGYAVQNTQSAATSQMWQIIPVHISSAGTASRLVFAPAPASPQTANLTPGTIKVAVENSAGALLGSAYNSVTVAISGPGLTTSETVAASGGVASLTFSSEWAVPGTYTLTATSSGLTLATATVVVNPYEALAQPSSTPSPSSYNQSAAFSATLNYVGNGTPSGAVTFSVTNTSTNAVTTLPASCTPASGTETCTATETLLAPGAYTVVASAAADANYPGATSASTAQTVTTQTLSQVTPSATSEPYGTAVPVTFTVNYVSVADGAAAPSGTVTFNVTGSGTATATCTLSAVSSTQSSCSTGITGLSVGNYSLSVTYAGDTNYAGASSSGSAFVVSQATASLGLVAATPGSATGGVTSTLLTATMSPKVPGVTVTFTDSTTGLTATGTTDATGTATVTPTSTTPGIAAGLNSVKASIASTANYTGAAANAVPVYFAGILVSSDTAEHTFSVDPGMYDGSPLCNGSNGTNGSTCSTPYGIVVSNFTASTQPLAISLNNAGSPSKAFSYATNCPAGGLPSGKTCNIAFYYLPPYGDGCLLNSNGCSQGTFESASWQVSGAGQPTGIGEIESRAVVGSGATVFPSQLGGKALLAAGNSLSVTPSSLSFGPQAPGAVSGTQNVTVTNNGAASVSVSYALPGGAFSATNGCAASLDSGATCQIGISYSNANVAVDNASLVLNPSSGSAITVAVTGTTQANSGLSLSTTAHNFSNVTVSTTASFGLSITNNSTTAATLAFGAAGSTEFQLQTSGCPFTLAASATCQVSVTFAPTSLGAVSGALTINSNVAILPGGTGSNGSYSDSVSFAGTGASGGTFSATTAGHNFGSVAVGSAATAYGLTLTNGTGATVALTFGGGTFASNGPADGYSVLTNCGATLAANASCQLQFGYAPSTAGTTSVVYPVTAANGATNYPLYSGGAIVGSGGITLTGTGQ